jgi:hypothetical protein
MAVCMSMGIKRVTKFKINMPVNSTSNIMHYIVPGRSSKV